MKEITRAEFVQAVRDFKKEHHIKLKELFNKKTEKQIIKAFWDNPIIREYLARPLVDFRDDHPDLDEELDHHEIKIYKYAPHKLPFRNANITHSRFYAEGVSSKVEWSTPLLKKYCQGNSDIEVDGRYDIYEIARITRQLYFDPQEQNSATRFFIHSNSKDSHATTVLSIVDPKTHHVLATFFMNSSKDSYYFQETKTRFLKHAEVLCFSDEVYKNINNQFSVDIKAESKQDSTPCILVNKEKRTALLLHIPITDPKYDELLKSPDIDTLYCYGTQGFWSTPRLNIDHTPHSPFIDVSHDLQSSKEDLNCVLYSMNFIRAMTTMLKNPDVADRAFSLAQSIKSDPSAEAQLVNIFREDLKAYLPCYYNQEGQPKPQSELKTFHLNQRWKMGGALLRPESIDMDVSTQPNMK